MDKFHSLPNLKSSVSNVSDSDIRRLYSLSLSQLKKHSEFSNYSHKPAPFNVRWLHGYNCKAGVINLNDAGSTTAFYAATNCGILYNWTTNQMRILQGHRHMICFIQADAQGRWLVTADSGPENVIIIWDSTDYFPQRTLFSPHGPAHLARLALSADAKYLLTLAYSHAAVIYWWIWAFGLDEPHAKIEINAPKDSIVKMGFNPNNTLQFLLMTKHDIWIGCAKKIFVIERGILKETDDYELKVKVVEKKINPDFGKLSCYTFVGPTSQVIVGTTRGAVLVYGYTMEYHPDGSTNNEYDKLKFVKPLRIEKHKINDIVYVDGFVVTCNTGGEIHFYDDQMKLMYWVHGFTVDNAKQLSFNLAPRSYQILDPSCGKRCICWEQVETSIDPDTGYVRQKLVKKLLPSDTTTVGKPFIIRDFIVCAEEDGIGFVDFVTEKLHIIKDNKTSPALALTVHPEKPFVCIGYANGIVEMFNFVQHNLFKRLDLRDTFKIVIPPKDDSINCNYEITIPKLSVTCLKYSPSGLHCACGLNTGEMLFLDPTTIDLLTKVSFKDTKYAIKEINFSPDSLTMVFSDIGRTVGVYKYDCEEFVWKFIGKHRAHYKEVHAIFFLPLKNDSGDYKLISLGADRIMVEYDIGKSGNDYLEILSLDRIEQTAIPLTGIVWPTPNDLDEEEHRLDLPTILIANSENKYKIINYETTMTLATVLGPRFEHPVNRMELISKREGDVLRKYILFGTKNVIGLQRMPLDGNPWKHVGMLGHPRKILRMCFREDCGILFTIGAHDSVMMQWAANYRSIETSMKQGGVDLDPYYCLVEDGRPGWLFQEVRDLFYYIQILCQGTFSPAMRRVKDFIPIDSLPDLMRALGYFPSEYEVENLLVEAKFKVYLKKPVTEIDFEEFVKLYLNHRPAFGDNFRKIRSAFFNLSSRRDDENLIDRDDFISMLEEHGEHFPKELSWYLLSILSGHSFEDRANMIENDFSFLPEDISFSILVNNIMGIQDVDSISEQISVKSVSDTASSSSLDSEEQM